MDIAAVAGRAAPPRPLALGGPRSMSYFRTVRGTKPRHVRTGESLAAALDRG